MTALRKRRDESPGHILVAYDGSEPAHRGLLHAAGMAGNGGRVTVVNVIPVQGVSARLETVSDAQDAKQRRLLHEAHSLLAKRGVKAELVGVAGDPVTEILAAAEKAGAGTIVVGRKRGRRAFHGHLGDRLVRRATCDVLVVR
jgi:nucleotide-binding universal stress UspA family protein